MASRSRRQANETRPAPPAELGWPTWVDPIAVQQLREPVDAGRVGHAYLLTGPKGVGKAALASGFAQSLCCTESEDGDLPRPCSACRACRNVARRAHPDVEWFDLAAQTSFDPDASQTSLTIDTVRRLRGAAALFPLEARRRIIIVDDAETLLEPAQQALLKTLEEPPPAVTILLLTDDAEVLLETVRSRCQDVRVRPVPEGVIERALVERGTDERESAAIAVLSRGAPAWALAAAADARLVHARQEERDAAGAWLLAEPYERLVTAFKLGEQFGKRRGEVIGVVATAVQLLREWMIQAADAGSGAQAIGRALAACLQCLSDLDANVRPRLALEAMVMQWPRLDPPPE